MSPPTDDIPSPRKRADFPRVFRHERTWPTDSGRQADMSAAEMLAGAAPERAPDWHSIEWKKVWRTVRRLQARIVKAVVKAAASREGRS